MVTALLLYHNYMQDEGAACGPSFRFSVCSYNILADKYAKHFRSWLYNSVASCHLDWQHRRAMLVAELAHLQPDVICLQEVDRYDSLEPDLEQLG
jgi:mRNA deadenylase 3'-5' endonuclease subunit Ccr4